QRSKLDVPGRQVELLLRTVKITGRIHHRRDLVALLRDHRDLDWSGLPTPSTLTDRQHRHIGVTNAWRDSGLLSQELPYPKISPQILGLYITDQDESRKRRATRQRDIQLTRCER